MLSQNALKKYVRLANKKYREQDAKFLTEGARLCEEALNADWPVECVLFCKTLLRSPRACAAVEAAQGRGIPVHEVEPAVFERLSQTKHAQGLVAVVQRRRLQDDPFAVIRQLPRCLWVAIDRLHNPGNLGTIIRTAAWLGVDGMLISDDCVELFNPKVLRASMGAIFHLAVHEVADLAGLLRRLQQFGCVTYAADQAGDFPYTALRYANKRILLLGDEIDGLSEEVRAVAQHRVAIPAKGHGESLNVAIAAAILLAEMAR